MAKLNDQKISTEILQSGELLNKICSLGDEVIIIHDSFGKITNILSDNPLTNYIRLSLVKDTFFEDQELQKKIEKNIVSTIFKKATTTFKTQLFNKGKIKHLEVKQSPLFENQIITMISDVTSQANLKESISINNDDVVKQNSLKSKFIREISHEIRTPLNAVMGYAHLLGKKDLNNEERQNLLERLINSARDMTVLVDDVVNTTLIINNQLSVICNDYNINVIMNNLKLYYQQKNSVVYNKETVIDVLPIEGERSLVYIDSGRFEQILRYLLEIATKYSTSDNISLEASYDEDDLLKIDVKYTGDFIPNKIVDTINSRRVDLNNILDISSGREFLGLNIASGLAQILSGDLNIRQNQRHNICMSFTMPVPKGKLAYHTPHIGSKYSWKNKVILIAEDEEPNILLFKELFEETKAHLIFAETGQQVIDLFETISQIDLLLLDVKMPVLSGIEVARYIRESGSKMPIVVQTGFSDPRQKEEVMETGVNNYFEKPINVELLMETINDYLNE